MTIGRILTIIGKIILVGALYAGIDKFLSSLLRSDGRVSELSYYYDDRYSFKGRNVKQKLLILLLSVLIGIAIQISFSYLLDFILSFFEGAAEKYGQIIERFISMEPGMIAYVGILAPVYEEFTFRGATFLFLRAFLIFLLFEMLEERKNESIKAKLEEDQTEPFADRSDLTEAAVKDRTQRKIHIFANILQAFFFAIYHGNIFQEGYAFVIGLLFGELCLLTGSVIPGIVAHSTVNLFGLYMDRIFPESLDRFIEPVITVIGLVVITEAMYGIRKIMMAPSESDPPVGP
ncbi:MAG: CPBP family intramembrane metalloprotease [Lachnospiraceae bacterium]|nr:CPBP family intramembrane metalloprotease [Lachnospiraceae bacterium]